MKKLIAMMVACMLLLAVAGCSSTTSSEMGKIEKIKEAGELVMLTNAYFPPFEYIADDGSIKGVDVDIAQAIADELGVKLTIMDVEFEGLVGGVQSGKGDIGAAGLTIKPDRQEMVDFSNVYYTSSQYMVVRADDTSINTLADASGKIFGAQAGTTGEFFCTDEEEETFLIGQGYTAESVQTYKTAADAAMALLAGKIDVLVVDELPARAIVEANPGLRVVEEKLTDESYAIAVAKGDQEFLDLVNSVVDRLIEDGTIGQWVTDHSVK